MTVSRVFRNPITVSAQTRDKVLSVSARLGYVPNLAAGILATGRSHLVAAVVPSIRNSNFSTMLEGLGERLSAEDYHLIVSISSDLRREQEDIEAILGRRPDGIVLTGSHHRPSVIEMLRKSRFSVVETWELGGPFIDSAVGLRTYEAACAMTQILIDKGYRNIGYADFETQEERRFIERRKGFQEVLRAAGLNDNLIFSAPEHLGLAGGRMAIEALTALEPRLDALFCVTDVFAAGAMLECIRREWEIPGQLAIAGFGDFEIAKEIPPGLTTVATHGYQIGYSAGEIILTRMKEKSRKPRIVDVGFEIILRGSI